MKKNVTRTACTVLAGTVLIGSAGCSLFDKSKDEVKEAAKAYCDAVISRDVDDIAELSEDGLKKNKENAEAAFDFSTGEIYTEAAAEFMSEVADTLTYEIDEESVKASAKDCKGSIDVIFTVADVDKILDEDYDDKDELIDSVSSADTIEIEITLEFVKEDEEWFVVDSVDVLEDVYDFLGRADDLAFLAIGAGTVDDDLMEQYGIVGASFLGCDTVDEDNNIAYSDTTPDYYICVSMTYLTTDGDPDFTGFYATAELNGEIVAEIYDEVYLAVYTDADGTVEAGNYTFTFYDPYGNAYWSGMIIVS
ncbi:hypothetical protein SAMN05216413_1737 [Ruminococcaceae bacterium KH2T8]|nr:hypothetical protein SAMN05216413_1737 [Ruminococcaceae bacterium KH2T8]